MFQSFSDAHIMTTSLPQRAMCPRCKTIATFKKSIASIGEQFVMSVLIAP